MRWNVIQKLLLTGIAALFLATGAAHAEVLMFMPPAKYDKPFTGGDLTIFRVATQQDMRDICLGFNKQKSLPATACSKTNQTTRCYIFVLTDQALKTIGSNYAIVLRHELAMAGPKITLVEKRSQWQLAWKCQSFQPLGIWYFLR